MRQVGRVVRVWETIHAYKILTEALKERFHLEDPCVDGRRILMKLELKVTG